MVRTEGVQTEFSSKPLDSGEKILYMYFEKFPQNQQQFAAFRNTPLMMLKGKKDDA